MQNHFTKPHLLDITNKQTGMKENRQPNTAHWPNTTPLADFRFHSYRFCYAGITAALQHPLRCHSAARDGERKKKRELGRECFQDRNGTFLLRHLSKSRTKQQTRLTEY